MARMAAFFADPASDLSAASTTMDADHGGIEVRRDCVTHGIGANKG